MKSKNVKRLLASVLSLSMLAGATAFVNAEEPLSGKITVWATIAQAELDGFISDFNKVCPDIEVEGITIPGDTYQAKLETALRTGAEAPDVFLLADTLLAKYCDTDLVENLSADPYNADELMDDFIPYVAQMCKDSEGNVKYLSHQATPGGFWYNRKNAKEYLGTDDPAELNEMFTSWDAIIEKAAEVNEKSGGSVYLLDSFSSVWLPMLGAKQEPFVVDGKVTELDRYYDILENTVAVRANNGDTGNALWSADWATTFYENQNFILCGLPTWGLSAGIYNNVPKDATDAEGAWGFCLAPESYRDGGSFWGIYSGSENKEAAYEFIRRLSADVECQSLVVERSGDFVAYIPTIEKIIEEGFTHPLTGEQNLYSAFYEAALKITPYDLTPYDAAVKSTFYGEIGLVADGEMSIDEYMEEYKSKITTQFPELSFE